jgi:hypothetical protein
MAGKMQSGFEAVAMALLKQKILKHATVQDERNVAVRDIVSEEQFKNYHTIAYQEAPGVMRATINATVAETRQRLENGLG